MRMTRSFAGLSESIVLKCKAREELADGGIELIAPNRKKKRQRTQDGRPLRRYLRRWKIERLFAWSRTIAA